MNARAEARQRPGGADRARPTGLLSRLRAWREQHLYALVSSLGRLLRRPFATLLTVGVMAVAIALPLGLGLAMANIERFSGSVTESREIGVFLKPDIDVARAESLAEQLRARPDVAAVSVRTPEEGLAEFRAMSDLAGALEVLEENPLPAVLVVQPGDGDGDALAASLRELPEAEIVQHDALWRQRLSAWLAFGGRVVQVLAVLLGLGVLLVVGNTVRLDIGARREEIAVLQHLGATDGFVRRPFLYLGAWYGLAAGLLALLLLAVAGAFLQGPLAALVASYGAEFRLAGPGWRGAGLLLAAALGMGWLGAWLATGHHLRQTRPTDV
ncbi:MAG TPA: permease-like cell division protein FtsX [Arenimonas sp.]|jgi:cell division transport system permease protein|nr:permease-like cell division protein FtsX [Arenimonas sp.]